MNGLDVDLDYLNRVTIVGLGSQGMATVEEAAGRILVDTARQLSHTIYHHPDANVFLSGGQLSSATGISCPFQSGGSSSTSVPQGDNSWGQDAFRRKWMVSPEPRSSVLGCEDTVVFLAPAQEGFGQDVSATTSQKAYQVRGPDLTVLSAVKNRGLTGLFSHSYVTLVSPFPSLCPHYALALPHVLPVRSPRGLLIFGSFAVRVKSREVGISRASQRG